MSRVTAALHASLLLLGVAFGSLVDRRACRTALGNRRGVMRVCTLALCALVAAVAPARAMAVAGHARVVLADGLADSRLHAVVDGREGSQPSRAFGDRDRASSTSASSSAPGCCSRSSVRCSIGTRSGDLAAGWDRALALLADSAAFGALMTLSIRVPRSRHRPARPRRARRRNHVQSLPGGRRPDASTYCFARLRCSRPRSPVASRGGRRGAKSQGCATRACRTRTARPSSCDRRDESRTLPDPAGAVLQADAGQPRRGSPGAQSHPRLDPRYEPETRRAQLRAVQALLHQRAVRQPPLDSQWTAVVDYVETIPGCRLPTATK